MRWNAWVALVIAMLAGSFLWVILLRGPRILDHDTTLVLGQLLLGMGVLAIAGLLSNTPITARKLPIEQSRRIIVGGTIFLQLIGVLFLWPALSSDVGRYRVDGQIWLHGRSPYAVTPREALANPDALDQTTTSRNSFTIYPPVAQTVFIAARTIENTFFRNAASMPADSARRSWRSVLPQVSYWQRALVLRLIFATAAVACSLVLLSLLQHAGRSPWLAVLFVWNPLLLIETAGQGHVDIVGILLLLAMLRMVQIQNFSLATLAFCLACGVKPMLILLAPLLIRFIRDRQSWRLAQQSIGIVALTLATIYGPMLMVQHGYVGWLRQLNSYAHSVEFNSGLYTFGKTLIGASWTDSYVRSLLLMLTPLTAAGVMLWTLSKRLSLADSAYWLMLAPLLVTPAAPPWSILWPLCVVPLMRQSHGWAALTWAATAALAYSAWHQPVYEVPARIVLAEYLPVLMAMANESRDLLKRSPQVIRISPIASA